MSSSLWLTVVSGLNQDPVVSYRYLTCFDTCIACVNIQIDIQVRD